MNQQKKSIQGIVGVALILSPIVFLLTLLTIYFGIVLTIPKQANHIAYLAGPLVGFVVSCLAWTLILLVILGIPSGIVLLFLSFRKKNS